MNSENTESQIPEFVFRNATVTKYENNSQTLKLSAAIVEQYKDNGSIYAKSASFKTFDSEETEETSGSCNYISANIDKKIYAMFGNINLELQKQNTRLIAERLKFDKNSEQITSSYEDDVSLKKEDLEITGKGFRASALGKNFDFSNSISGKILTEE